MKSDVFFVPEKGADIRARLSALLTLLRRIEKDLPYAKDEFIPVKFTIGDSRCIYNIHPEMVKPIIALIKKKKAKPFLFDTNVIYSGQRQNTVDHLNLVQNKGFGAYRIGAPYVIVDGIFGQDGKEFSISSDYIKKIKVPSFITMLDSLLVLSHVTGHILTGFASSLKNVAMGMVTRATKLAQHSSIKPHIIKDKCTMCGYCIVACSVRAISAKSAKAVINQEKCIGCGECICACKFDAIFIHWEDDDDLSTGLPMRAQVDHPDTFDGGVLFAKRMIDVAGFVLSKFKHKFFINFAFDITKECDCISTKTDPIIAKNIGILASSDPVSLDIATLDLINKENPQFRTLRPHGVCNKMLDYAAKTKLGNSKYNLIIL